MARCPCCGRMDGCMFTPDSSALRIRNLAPTAEQSTARMTRKAERMAEEKKMSDKRKQRIRSISAELGCSHRAAANVLERRKACPHPLLTLRADGSQRCGDCGQVLPSVVVIPSS